MRNLPFKRHQACLVYLVIGSQLLGCTSAAVGAAPQSDDWAPAASYPTPLPPPHVQPPIRPQFGPVAVQPNFKAPAANNCARPIRTTEVPGRAMSGQTDAGWALRSEAVASTMTASDSGRSRADTVRKSASPRAEAPPPPLAMAAPAPSMVAKESGSAEARGVLAQRSSLTESNRHQPLPENNRVTAGVVDDNANFGEYLAFRQRTQVPHRARDIAERYLLQVNDRNGRGVPDAEVRVQSPSGQAMWARTDAAGQVWVSPNAFDSSRASTYQVSVRKPGSWGMAQAVGFLQRGQKSAVEVTLDSAGSQRAQLDLVFLVDATGSMGDEIDKLKATLRTIANEVANLPAKPDLCFGLVAYRDKTDEYLIRSHDFTNDLNAFQGVLNQLQASGGGDYPEAMNEALHATVHNLSWRGNGTTRMVFLLADAPPHLDYSGPQYDDSMAAALGMGIKVFGVGASGLDKQGEYIQRQIAQYTGGKFVFLTYDQASNPASGPGRETVHDVQNYSVDSLDRLIVRLVREDLAKLGRMEAR